MPADLSRPDPASSAFSIVIPALNVESVIEPCLESLTRLDYPADAFEVIVVDNGSTDRTLDIVKGFSGRLHLTVFVKPDLRISALRNFGVSQSKGRCLAFLDSDCVVYPSWLSNAERGLAQETIGVVGAHYQIPEHSSWLAQAWYGGLETEKQGDQPWLPGGDLITTRRLFDQVGGFDESIQTNEDCEFCFRVWALGRRVVGDAALAVIHLGTPQTLGVFYRKIRWHGQDGLRVFLRDLPKVSNARPLLFALYTIVCVLGLGIAVGVALWRHTFLWIGVLGAAWLAPALALSLRLVRRRRAWRQWPALTAAHMVYGLAKGHAILDVRNWMHSRGSENR